MTVLINTYNELLLREVVVKRRRNKILRLLAKNSMYLLLCHSPGAERTHFTRF